MECLRLGVPIGCAVCLSRSTDLPAATACTAHLRHAPARQVVAGLAADGRAVVDRAQSEAQQYKGFYGHPIPGHVLAERLASYVHVFNLYWYVRPMGVTSLLGVYDEEGPALYAVDPAGTVHRYYGTAVGKGRQAARNEIEKLRPGELTVREGVRAVAQILHRVHDEEKPFEAELAWVCEESGRTFQRVPQVRRGRAVDRGAGVMNVMGGEGVMPWWPV